MKQNLSDFTAWLKKLFTAQETALIKKFSSAVPPYAIMWFKRTTAPAGWAICDGRQVSMEDGTVVTTPNLIDKYPLGAKSSIGSAVDAGLPNITGAWAVQANSSSENGPNAGRGAIKTVRSDGRNGTAKPSLGYTLTQGGGWNDGGYNNQGIEFSAAWSNSIYGKSSTVTPPSIKLLPCMKL